MCNRNYSTNALDAVKQNKKEAINDLSEVTVSEHIRQIEQANLSYGRPLPYHNDEEKQQYIKSENYYNSLKTRQSSLSQPMNRSGKS